MYPVTYEPDYRKDRNRLTTFFRLILAITWILVAFVYMIATAVVVIVAWVLLVILGRYPQGLYDFVGGILRFYMRVTAFVTLQTDAWPPFGISADSDYPVRINFAPPAARQSRLKAFFRIILIIPLLLMTYIFSTLQQAIAVLAWVTIVFRGYQPAGVHNALAFTNSWYTRAYAYMFLMRDEYPSVGDEITVKVSPPVTALPPGDDPAPEQVTTPGEASTPDSGVAESQQSPPGKPPAPG